MTGNRRRTTIRLVTTADGAPPPELTADDALSALLQAQLGYRAAVDAADGVSLPSLTEFVD